MATSFFMADERDIKFALYEHLDLDRLLKLPQFSELSVDTIDQVLRTTLDLCHEVVGPLNALGDREGCRFNKETFEVRTPTGFKEAYLKYCEAGYLVFTVPAEKGGLGMPHLLGALATELFTGANAAFMMYPGLSRSACHLLEHHAPDWIQQHVLPQMHSGAWAGTMCLTEPSVGTAVGDLLSRAAPEGDHYLIDGVKQWVSAGEQDLTENIMHMVLARIEGAPPGIKGVSLFMVPKFNLDRETGALTSRNDVKCISIEEKMGIHGNATCLLRMGDEGRCVGYLIGEANQGINYMFLMMNEARLGVGIQGLAIASCAFLNAQEYARGRIQGTPIESFKDVNAERVPIIVHPDVRRMLMRQRSIVEGCRALIYFAAYCADLSLFHPDADERDLHRGYLELLTPVVKAWSTDMGFDVSCQALQTYGGYGYTTDYPVEQYVRDLKVGSIYEGTNGVQALDLVGRKLRMKGGMVFMGWIQRMNDFVSSNEDHAVVGGEVKIFEEMKNEFAETAMYLSQVGMTGNQRAAVLNATPFLISFGHLTVAFFLLEQAVIAAAKVKDAQGSDRVFYRNKIRTTRFFVHNVLSEARGLLSAVRSGDLSALDFEFEDE